LAVVVTVAKGYELGYIWKTQGEAAGRATGGYYISAAQAGEPPTRWWGPGVQALGLTPGQIVQRTPGAEPARHRPAMTSPGDPTAWMRLRHLRSSGGRLVLAAAAGHDHAVVLFDLEPDGFLR
jgi:hypothetical protein